jgi:uncharacterized protein
MIFEINAERIGDNEKQVFYYDNQTNVLKDSVGNIFEYPDIDNSKMNNIEVVPFDKNTPLRKSRNVSVLKIQMGLSCNYSCDYCSQKFVERPTETSKKDIDAFLEKFDTLNFSEKEGLKIEFWGGEPFVYWKTMKPLAEAIKDRFSHWTKEPRLTVITNGSILNKEICAWLYYMGFSVSISHDGPGQAVRGLDPFDDPKQKKIILDFYKIMRKQNRISFNSMLNHENRSRKAIYDWFVELTGDPNVTLGEGTIVDAYDEDGVNNSLSTKQDHFEYRKLAFNDIYSNNGNIGNPMILSKIDGFRQTLLTHGDAKFLGQKCGMDLPNVVATDMRGNVFTCQNVSAVEVGPNGEQHLGGTLENIEDVEIKAATHWMNRRECPSCPVLHICKGSCMFLDQKYWDVSCQNSYSDNIVFFSLAFERITNGFVPVLIKGDGLPLDRQDIWGNQYIHDEEPKRKVIPIKVVSEIATTIDDVAVYGKSKVLAE